MAPSPTADATRFIESSRTSPAAKTPGRLDSRAYGARASGQAVRSAAKRSLPVTMKPCSSRTTGNRLGPLLLFGGAAWLLGALQNTAVPALIGAGLICASLPLSVVVHLLHACPSGRLRNRSARWTVGAGYFVGIVLQAPLWAFTPQPPPFDAVLISPRPDLALDWYHVQQWCGGAVVVASVWQLVR